MPRRRSRSALRGPPRLERLVLGHDLDQLELLLQRVVRLRRPRGERNRERQNRLQPARPPRPHRRRQSRSTGPLTATGAVLAASFTDSRQLMIQGTHDYFFPTDMNQVQDWVRFTTSVNGSLAWTRTPASRSRRRSRPVDASSGTSGARSPARSHRPAPYCRNAPTGGVYVTNFDATLGVSPLERASVSARSLDWANSASEVGRPGAGHMHARRRDAFVVSRRRTPDGERHRADSVTSGCIHRRPPRPAA